MNRRSVEEIQLPGRPDDGEKKKAASDIPGTPPLGIMIREILSK